MRSSRALSQASSLSYAARLRHRYPYKPPSTSVDHVVIGGGVVGLSVAAGLVNTAGRDRTTFVVERNAQLGQETTARNSEVIHSGIYYPVGSLKSKLCIRGRDLVYARCKALDIGHKETQKLIVATSNRQVPFLDKLSTLSADPRLRTSSRALSVADSDSLVPAYFLSSNEAREMEPDLGSNVVGALLITETGIFDSQGLVDSLAREIEEEDYLGSLKAEDVGVGLGHRKGKGREDARGEGVVVLGTRVVRIDREEKGKGWIVQLETGWEGLEAGQQGEVESVRADVVVNAAGLGSTPLLEGIVPENEMVMMWPVKGNYLSYKGPGVENVSRLIYPCPSDNVDHLGIHLTLDLDGHIKFGPDVEPIGSPEDMRNDPDLWRKHLSPDDSRIPQFARSIQDYLPGVDPANLQPDYSGIRPNIAPPGAGFSDFMIRHKEDRKGFVELLGFNSPGLTSGLATGEHVARMIRRDVWGDEQVGKGLEYLAEGWE